MRSVLSHNIEFFLEVLDTAFLNKELGQPVIYQNIMKQTLSVKPGVSTHTAKIGFQLLAVPTVGLASEGEQLPDARMTFSEHPLVQEA